MGVKMKDGDANKVLLGVSYNGGGKWVLLCGEERATKEHSSNLETQTDATQYQVAIVLQNGTQGTAYVDGKRVESVPCAFGNKEDKMISHFFIGGDGSSTGSQGVSVTVRNVLLYNRPLNDDEIGALNPKKGPITPLMAKNALDTLSPSTPGGTQPSRQGLSKESKGADGGSASPSAV
ncbi:trans-sialidase, putative, partial [Trypanosoma cruzi marinkellei]